MGVSVRIFSEMIDHEGYDQRDSLIQWWIQNVKRLLGGGIISSLVGGSRSLGCGFEGSILHWLLLPSFLTAMR